MLKSITKAIPCGVGNGNGSAVLNISPVVEVGDELGATLELPLKSPFRERGLTDIGDTKWVN